jgi:hypothetical protein
MYVVVRKYPSVKEMRLKVSEEELQRMIKERFVPQIENVSGFIHYSMAFLSDGKILSVSLFNREASISESIRLASLWISENMPAILKHNPEIFCGKIAVQDGKIVATDCSEQSDTPKKSAA